MQGFQRSLIPRRVYQSLHPVPLTNGNSIYFSKIIKSRTGTMEMLNVKTSGCVIELREIVVWATLLDLCSQACVILKAFPTQTKTDKHKVCSFK